MLDTTFLVSAERAGNQVGAVIADQDDVAVAAVTIAELLVGVELAGEQARASRQGFVDAVLQTIPVLNYDVKVAYAHAGLLAIVRRQGRPRGAHDLIIAATARAYSRAVVSADRTAFEDLPGVIVATAG